jgi:5-methylcytosine-specific restriction endonuclease McrA
MKSQYQANPEKYKQTAKDWQRKNSERYKELDRKSHKENYVKNAEKLKARVSAWAKKNPDKRRAMRAKRRTAKTSAGGAYTSTQWIALCDKHGNVCLCCHKKKKLTGDHVMPVSKGGSSSISNIQPLCRPCNSRKGTRTTDYR